MTPAPGVIVFDAMVAWHLRSKGCEVTEWLSNLQRSSEGRDEGSGLGTVAWRLKPDRPPSGAWAARLELVVREDGYGILTPQNMTLRGGVYLPSFKPAGAGLMLDLQLPETAVSALVGRRVGDLADIPPVADQLIAEAHRVDIMPGMDDIRTNISFDPVFEMHETPFFLLP